MSIFKLLKNDNNDSDNEPKIDSGSCDDCDWSGLLNDADTDSEWDDFYRVDRPYPICPKCGGPIDGFYPSSID